MPRGGGEHRIPGRLTVVVRVDVDPARRDQMTVGLDVAARRAGEFGIGRSRPRLDERQRLEHGVVQDECDVVARPLIRDLHLDHLIGVLHGDEDAGLWEGANHAARGHERRKRQRAP